MSDIAIAEYRYQRDRDISSSRKKKKNSDGTLHGSRGPRISRESRLKLACTPRREGFLPLHGQLSDEITCENGDDGIEEIDRQRTGRHVRHDTVDSAQLVLSLGPTLLP